MKEKEWKGLDEIQDFNKDMVKKLEVIKDKLNNPIWKEIAKPAKVNILKLVIWTLRICLAIVVLITSAISMTYSQYDVWIAVFCLALLNIVDLAEKE